MELLSNARIYTFSATQPVVEALLIGPQGKIQAIGRQEDLREAYATCIQREEDLGGATVLPGLTDAHIHLRHYALNLRKVDCATTTKEACLARVAQRARLTPPGQWILGHGWNQNDWGDAFPTAADLDKVAPHHPVYLTAQSLHAAWVNSTALAQAHITAQTPDPANGRIGRDDQGRPNGLLFEGAMRLASQIIPPPTEEETLAALRHAQETLWGLGITSVHDFDRVPAFRALQRLHERGELRLRVLKNLPIEALDALIEAGLRSGFGDDWLCLGGLKAFADGALGPRTAAMFQPYTDRPGERGMLLLDAEAILAFARRAVTHGLSLTIHAIGDRANHEVLNAYEHLRAYERAQGLPPLRHRLEHAQLLHPQDVPRLGRLGVIASMQPFHALSDRPFAQRAWGERCATAYAWRSISNQGAVLAFGSDAPVEAPNPWLGLYAAVQRAPLDTPEQAWYPQERLSLQQALAAYTTGPAYAAGWENHLGRLAPGYAADLIVLRHDPFRLPPEALPSQRPLATMVGGRWVWQASP
ncbi:MAG TPA: amidohydrolase [Anaerolineae bacterium]|nr:amidohydrolase [Anaerolineae bacterium]